MATKKEKKYCKSPDELKNLFYEKSLFILKQLDAHRWVLANEGSDYHYKSYFKSSITSGKGCQNATGATKKSEQNIDRSSHCEADREHNLSHQNKPDSPAIKKSDVHTGTMEVGI